MSSFLEALRREMAALKAEPPEYEVDLAGYYGLLEAFNLGKYRNSELAWTMNRNHLLPAWRITLGQ